LNELGSDPIIRLQSGGLKCGELMLSPTQDQDFADLLQWVVRPHAAPSGLSRETIAGA